MANPQTKASRKYNEKMGIVSKSYVVKKETAQRFKEACKAAGISQAKAIEDFMNQFIKDQIKEDQ